MVEMLEQQIAVDWWNAKSEHEARDRLVAWYGKVKGDDVGRLGLLERHLRMYGNMPVNNNGLSQYIGGWEDEDKLRLNIVKAACDAVTSKISKNSPMPFPEVSNANWSMSRKAKFLRQFFEAQFQVSRIPEVATDVFLDTAITGTGVLKLFKADKEIVAERIYPGEVFVEERDGIDRDPYVVVQRKLIDRGVAMKKWPKFKTEIVSAGRSIDHNEEFGGDDYSDQILCLEAWRRPSSPGKKDGRHLLIIDNATIVDEPWKDCLPFVFLRWSRRPRGFWGIGLAEELTGIQVEINRLLRKIQAAMHLVSVPRIFVEQGSKVTKAYLNNKIGMVIPYTGQKPIFEVAQSVAPDMFNHLNWLYQKGFEISGLSMLNSGPSIPQVSGVALTTMNDIETERFASVGKAWEQMHMDIAEYMVVLAKEIGGKFVLKNDKYSVVRVPWADIDMPRDSFVLRVEPTSALPTTTAGRLQHVETMLNAGMITDPKEARRLLNFPDFEAELRLDEAAYDNIRRIVENIVDEGRYEAPEPYMDLDLAIKVAQAEYNRVIQFKDIPETHLQKLRLFMEQTHRMLKAAMAEQQALQAPPAAGAPPPPGSAGQAPTAVTPSDGVV